jgi:pimeloyl-ACP methyl ester carboxylesterase
MREDFTTEVPGGALSGVVCGHGASVVLLHGGPGLSWAYLEPLVDELAAGYRVAVYQQRGLPPSTAGAPYDVTAHVADVVAVLDRLRWDRAVFVGHSWGGHLLLHLLAARPERVTAALILDTLGGVGDGGEAEFDDEMLRRTPRRDVERVEHLERQAMEGNGTETDLAESMRLLWPAYFAEPATAPPFPGMRLSVEAYAETFASLHAELPALAGRLAHVAVPTLFVHGGGSPMPVTAASDTAAVMGSAATVEVIDGAGHYPWIDYPGSVRSALDALVKRSERESG